MSTKSFRDIERLNSSNDCMDSDQGLVPIKRTRMTKREREEVRKLMDGEEEALPKRACRGKHGTCGTILNHRNHTEYCCCCEAAGWPNKDFLMEEALHPRKRRSKKMLSISTEIAVMPADVEVTCQETQAVAI